MTVTSLGQARYLLIDGDRRRLAYARADDRGRGWVWLDGRVFVVGDAAPAEARTGRHGDPGALMAPMPATVMQVNVAPGDRVSRGDVLVVLEAMKMELPVAAPRKGTVRSVACAPGDLVQPGVVLVDLD